MTSSCTHDTCKDIVPWHGLLVTLWTETASNDPGLQQLTYHIGPGGNDLRTSGHRTLIVHHHSSPIAADHGRQLSDSQCPTGPRPTIRRSSASRCIVCSLGRADVNISGHRLHGSPPAFDWACNQIHLNYSNYSDKFYRCTVPFIISHIVNIACYLCYIL